MCPRKCVTGWKNIKYVVRCTLQRADICYYSRRLFYSMLHKYVNAASFEGSSLTGVICLEKYVSDPGTSYLLLFSSMQQPECPNNCTADLSPHGAQMEDVRFHSPVPTCLARGLYINAGLLIADCSSQKRNFRRIVYPGRQYKKLYFVFRVLIELRQYTIPNVLSRLKNRKPKV